MAGTQVGTARRCCDELYCIDPAPQWFEDPKIKTRSGNTVKLVNGYSPGVLAQIPHPITFAFVDGDHSEAGVYRDGMALESLMETSGVICFHDASHPPVEEGLRRVSENWKRPHKLYPHGCDTVAQTEDGIWGGIGLLIVEPELSPQNTSRCWQLLKRDHSGPGFK